MGQTIASRASTGATVGAGIGAAAGGVTGVLTAGVVGFPSAVVGGAIGAIAGGGEASVRIISAQIDEINSAVCSSLAAAEAGRARAGERASSSFTEGKPVDVSRLAHLPPEALPLLCALSVARTTKSLTDQEAFQQAADFAARCASEQRTSEDGMSEKIFETAQAEGRQVLTFVKLRELYPEASKSSVLAASRQLVNSTDPDIIDAVWILCGSKPLQDWSPAVRSALPQKPRDITPDLLNRALDMKYEEQRRPLVARLQQLFPGGANDEAYAQRLVVLRDALSKASFWKAWKLLQQETPPVELQGLSFDHLLHPSFLEQMSGYLAGSSALCINGGANIVPLEHNFLTAAISPDRGPLAINNAPDTQSELHLEIFKVEGLSSSEYRLGDFARRLSGTTSLRPYVECSINLLCEGADPGSAKSIRYTRVVAASAHGSADFGEKLRFPIPRLLADSRVVGKSIELRVYDERGIQAVVRGDPLVGEGVLRLTDEVLGVPGVQFVQLSRGNQPSGTLTVRAGIIAPRSAYGVLAESKDRPLIEVVKAFSQVASQPWGVEALLKARPEELRSLSPSDELPVRRTIQQWLVRMSKQLSQLDSAASDDVALLHLARISRSCLQIVGMCAASNLDGAEVQNLTVTWVRQFFATCAGGAVQLNEERLRRLLEAGSHASSGEDTLERLGVSLPDGTSEEVSIAIAARVLEAERSEEEEIFTGERIVLNGRVAPGMGAVIRSSRAGGAPHVFLYELASIRQWQEQRGSDPSTRESLRSEDILPLHCCF